MGKKKHNCYRGFLFKKYFLIWAIFKDFIEFVTILFLVFLFFNVLIFWPQGMWDFSSAPPALEGKVLTTTLPGKSLLQRFLRKHHMYRAFCVLSHLALRDLEQCQTYQYIIGEWMKLKEKELLFNGNYCLLERMPSPSLRMVKDKINPHLSLKS